MNYDYKCEDCGEVHEEMRRMDDRNEPSECPECGGPCKLKIAPVPHTIKKYKRIYGKRIDHGLPGL